MAWQKGESGNPGGRGTPKPWKDAIARAIKRREESDPLALERLADKLLSKVAEGDVSAIKEFGDRVDGKVAQAIVGDEDHDAIQMNHTIQRVIVDPNTNGSGSTTTP